MSGTNGNRMGDGMIEMMRSLLNHIVYALFAM